MIASGNSKKDEYFKIAILLNTIGQYSIAIYNQFVPVPNKVEDLLV